MVTHDSGSLEPEHIASVFKQTCESHGDRPAMRIRAADSPTGWGKSSGDWLIQTWNEVAERVEFFARAFIDAGVDRGDRVVVFAPNTPEWTQVDIACQQIGAVVVPIYATSTVEQICHIVADSGATLIVTGGDKENERVVEASKRCGLQTIVSFAATDLPGVIPVEDFVADLSEASAEELSRREKLWSRDDLFSIIYTSGTTGEPRGVMISHRAMIAQNRALAAFFMFGPDEHSLAFLPLSHALERAWGVFCMSRGAMTTYCPDARNVAKLLVLAKPTLLVSVPRLYEKVAVTAREKVVNSPLKTKIFLWALRVGGQLQHAYRKGKKPRLYWRAQFPLADRLVLRAIRDAMGGPKTVLACGGAPLRVEVEEFFSAVGLPVLTGYGLTEASPLVSFNSSSTFKVGTAGSVIHGGELRIWDEGEILYRGPNVMDGYWGNPEATTEAFLPSSDDKDPRPWLKTGDIGYVDVDGFLVITDRLKDIIVTAGGKNIAPQPIEGLLMTDPLFEQAVLLGDNRPYLTLLVKPSLPDLAEIAERLSLSNISLREQLNHPQIIEAVKERARKITDRLPTHEQFKDLRVLLEDFTMENGLLTPTLKVRRREVEKRFSQIIEDMYDRVVDLKDTVKETVTDFTERVFDGAGGKDDPEPDQSAANHSGGEQDSV